MGDRREILRLMNDPRTLFFAVSLVWVLPTSSCIAPPQDFPIHSELWRKSNPEFVPDPSPSSTLSHRKVTVAILDGGIDYNHPWIRKQITPFPTSEALTGRSYGIGYDLLGGANDFFPHFSVLNPDDGQDLSAELLIREHGTHVAGLTTLGHPDIGLLPVRVLPIPAKKDEAISAELVIFAGDEMKANVAKEAIQHITRGMKLACEHGAQILNLSLGLDFSSLSPEFQHQVQAVLEADMIATIRKECGQSLLVVAAGNESREMNDIAFSVPATIPEKNIISVGALKSQADAVTAYYSNQGRSVDVYIRGSDIRSSVPLTEENTALRAALSGTSMAAPLIAHLAARIRIILPDLNPEQLRALILNTAKLKELTLEAHPEPEQSSGNTAARLPEKRMGLVADFATALRTARRIAEAAERGERQALENQFLTPPFDHGHSPF